MMPAPPTRPFDQATEWPYDQAKELPYEPPDTAPPTPEPPAPHTPPADTKRYVPAWGIAIAAMTLASPFLHANSFSFTRECKSLQALLVSIMFLAAVLEFFSFKHEGLFASAEDKPLKLAVIAQLVVVPFVGIIAIVLHTSTASLLGLTLVYLSLGVVRWLLNLRCNAKACGAHNTPQHVSVTADQSHVSPHTGLGGKIMPVFFREFLSSILSDTKQIGAIVAATVILANVAWAAADIQEVTRQHGKPAPTQPSSGSRNHGTRHHASGTAQSTSTTTTQTQTSTETTPSASGTLTSTTANHTTATPSAKCGKLKRPRNVPPGVVAEFEALYSGENSFSPEVAIGCPVEIRHHWTSDGVLYWARGEQAGDSNVASLAVVAPGYRNTVVLGAAVEAVEALIREGNDIHGPKTLPLYYTGPGAYYLLAIGTGTVVMLQEERNLYDGAESLVVLMPSAATAWLSTVRERGWLWPSGAKRHGASETFNLKRTGNDQAVERITYNTETKKATRPRVSMPYKRQGEFIGTKLLEEAVGANLE